MRPSWDEYFMNMAETVAERATCDRGKSGAVIVRDNTLLTTGYVGAPPKLPHCDDEGHLFHKVTDEYGHESTHCIRTLHAEENAILQAARKGPPLEGATIYCKMTPCFKCAMRIVRVGIVRVVAFRDYHKSQESKKIFKKAGIILDIINEDEIEKYEKQ